MKTLAILSTNHHLRILNLTSELEEVDLAFFGSKESEKLINQRTYFFLKQNTFKDSTYTRLIKLSYNILTICKALLVNNYDSLAIANLNTNFSRIVLLILRFLIKIKRLIIIEDGIGFYWEDETHDEMRIFSKKFLPSKLKINEIIEQNSKLSISISSFFNYSPLLPEKVTRMRVNQEIFFDQLVKEMNSHLPNLNLIFSESSFSKVLNNKLILLHPPAITHEDKGILHKKLLDIMKSKKVIVKNHPFAKSYDFESLIELDPNLSTEIYLIYLSIYFPKLSIYFISENTTTFYLSKFIKNTHFISLTYLPEYANYKLDQYKVFRDLNILCPTSLDTIEELIS